MQNDYFPKINENELCETINLCSVRKNESDDTMVAIKYMDGTVREEIAEDIIHGDEFEGMPIKRIYSSGHVFFNDKKDAVYLITVAKYGKVQHQFTGGSPKEDHLKNATFFKDGKVKFFLDTVEINAETRTKNRTSVQVTDVYNNIPTIDRALMETKNMESKNEETGEKFWNLVCLMHYAVKSYEGKLTPQIGVEHVVGGGRFKISDLDPTNGIAPNAKVVVQNMLENIDFSAGADVVANTSLIEKFTNKAKSLILNIVYSMVNIAKRVTSFMR